MRFNACNQHCEVLHEKQALCKGTVFLKSLHILPNPNSMEYLWDRGCQRLVHLCFVQSTVCMSLLQPQRETYNLFDDVLLLADGASCWECQCIPSQYAPPAFLKACRVYLQLY